MLENSPQGYGNCQENKTSCGEPCLHVSLSSVFMQFPNSKWKCDTENQKVQRKHYRSQPATKVSNTRICTTRTAYIVIHCLQVYTLFPTLFLHPGFRIKTEHHLSAIYLPTPLDLGEHCFVLSAYVVLVFDQVVTLRDPSFSIRGRPFISGLPSKTTRVSLTFGLLRVVFSSLNVVPSSMSLS